MENGNVNEEVDEEKRSRLVSANVSGDGAAAKGERC